MAPLGHHNLLAAPHAIEVPAQVVPQFTNSDFHISSSVGRHFVSVIVATTRPRTKEIALRRAPLRQHQQVARKHRTVSDPSLAREHPKGSEVVLGQMLEHKRLGTLLYTWPRHWAFHYNAAQNAYESLAALHEQVEQLAVGADCIRGIHDLALIEQTYDAGVRMVTGVVLALQHLSEEIGRTLKLEVVGRTIEDRLTVVAVATEIDLGKATEGYSAFQEICACRDAVEHPKPGNTYNGNPTEWDRVPLAWFFSDRSLACFETFTKWFGIIADKWEESREALPRTPATFNIERGIRSKRPFKKPPR